MIGTILTVVGWSIIGYSVVNMPGAIVMEFNKKKKPVSNQTKKTEDKPIVIPKDAALTVIDVDYTEVK